MNHHSSSDRKYVEAFISAISFSDTLYEFRSEVDEHYKMGYEETNLESLFREAKELFNEPSIGIWSAPKWATKDDIIFFYLAKDRPPRRVKKLIKKATETNQKDLLNILERNKKLIDRYSGTLFGCAKIVDSSYIVKQKTETHYKKNKTYALYAKCFIFENPLKLEEIEICVKIVRGATNTNVLGQSFLDIKQELSIKNKNLPDYLINSYPGGNNFKNVDVDSWKSISCHPDKTFVNEAQIRDYFLDYLLKEIKDNKSPLLKECRAYKKDNQYNNGIADYLIRVNNHWIAVEAKLNIQCEQDIIAQTTKYTNAYYFIPTIGKYKGNEYHTKSNLCLIGDMHGLYLVYKDRFIAGNIEEPAWKREELNHTPTTDIRNKIIKCLTIG